MPTAEQVLAEARRWLGTVERPFGSNRVEGITDWYGLPGQPWCAMFVSRVFHNAGLPLPASTSKGFAYTPAGAAWFQKAGRWRPATARPAPGDVVFFRMPGGPPRINHVGIVESVDTDGTVATIEGNTDAAGGRTGGQVMRRRRRGAIAGYGIPAYTAPAPPAPDEEDDMPLTDADVERIAAKVVDELAGGHMLDGRRPTLMAILEPVVETNMELRGTEKQSGLRSFVDRQLREVRRNTRRSAVAAMIAAKRDPSTVEGGDPDARTSS